MTNKKSIFKSVAVVTAFSVATRLFAFLFKVFVSRQFGASVVGVYQMALSFYFFASAVALSGLPTVISRKIAEDEKTGGENVPSLISTALVLSLSSVLPILSVIYPVAFLLPSVFADERVLPLVVIMLPALLSTSIYNVIRSWFWGKRSFLAFSFTEMLEEVLRITFTLIFSLGLIAAVTPLKGLAVGFLVSDIACAVVLFILFLIKKGIQHKSWWYVTIILMTLLLGDWKGDLFTQSNFLFIAIILYLLKIKKYEIDFCRYSRIQ